MTDRLIVEYVCTGNNGRSPMAEAIALDYVHRRGLEDRIEVCSSASGLLANDKSTWTIAKFKQDLSILNLAVQNGIYQEPWCGQEAQQIIERGNKQMELGGLLVMDRERHEEFMKLLNDIDGCVQYAVNMEAHFRNVALMEVGLFAGGKYHKPAEARHNGLILPMAQSNADAVRKIYASFAVQRQIVPPTIQPLNSYVGVEGDVPNPFCKLLAAYQASRDHLMNVVPMSIDKAVQEFRL